MYWDGKISTKYYWYKLDCCKESFFDRIKNETVENKLKKHSLGLKCACILNNIISFWGVYYGFSAYRASHTI